MRQTCLCGVAIAAALGFAPPANAGMVNVPTIRPSLPKVTPPKVTLQTPKAASHQGGGGHGGGGHMGGNQGKGHEGHTRQTVQTPTVTPTTPTVTPQTPRATYDISIGRVQ